MYKLCPCPCPCPNKANAYRRISPISVLRLMLRLMPCGQRRTLNAVWTPNAFRQSLKKASFNAKQRPRSASVLIDSLFNIEIVPTRFICRRITRARPTSSNTPMINPLYGHCGRMHGPTAHIHRGVVLLCPP